MKKIFLVIFLVLLFFSLVPVQTQAALVSCGPGTNKPQCEICDFFVLLDNIIDFFLLDIVFPIATLMIVIGGMMFLLAGENPEKLATAKKLLISALIGLILIFAAWAVLGLFFRAIGLADWTEDIYRNWQEGIFEIPCK